MKRLFLLIALVVMAAQSRAQDVDRFTRMLGGTGGISISKTEFYFDACPYIEYLLVDNWSIGAGADWIIKTSEGSTLSSLGMNVFTAYYIELAPGFYFKPTVEIGFDGYLIGNDKPYSGVDISTSIIPTFQYFGWNNTSVLVKAGSFGYHTRGPSVYNIDFGAIAVGIAYSF